VTSDGYQPSALSLTLAPNEHRFVHVALASEMKAAAAASVVDPRPLDTLAVGTEPVSPERSWTPAGDGRARTIGYVTAATGLAALATGVGCYFLSSNAFGTWQERQARLDDEWQQGQPYPPDLDDRQRRNDGLARDVAAQDRWALGLGVGGGVLLAVSLPLFFWTEAEASTSTLAAHGDRLTWRATW
jgi:hypothetical protein